MRKKQKEIGEEIAQRTGKKAGSAISFLNQLILGRRTVPLEWEKHLLEIMHCENKEKLRKIFPAMKFSGDSLTKIDGRYKVSLSMKEINCVFDGDNIVTLLNIITMLEKLGILIETTICPNCPEI